MTNMMNKIYFYYIKKPFGFFSNFSKHPVYIDGFIWLTSEHYYQAQKSLDPQIQMNVRMSSRPGIAAKLGQSCPLREDWEHVKDDIMRKAVRAKVDQHADVRQLLLDTGDAVLVEHTPRDSYWGDGGDGSGKNMLGKILMEIRADLISRGIKSAEGDPVSSRTQIKM
jgi:hypothetical protein